MTDLEKKIVESLPLLSVGAKRAAKDFRSDGKKRFTKKMKFEGVSSRKY